MLGLDTVGLVNETCKLAGIPRCTPDTIDIDDWEVWKDIRDDTTSIFQWNSDMASHLLKNLLSDKTMAKIRKEIPDVSLLQLFSFGNALIRPCGATVREEASNGKIIKTGIKELDDMLKNELGFALQQESYMKFAMQFCGFSQNEADKLRKCVSANTVVLMADGSTKKISDLSAGDRIISYNEQTGKFKGDNVVGVYDNGIKETYIIETVGGRKLRATSDHQVLTQRGWMEVKDLTSNDYVFVPEKIICDKDGKRPNQRYSAKELFVVGCLIGDGTLGGNKEIRFTNSDNDLISHYKECVKYRSDVGECEFNIYSTPGKTVDNIYTICIKNEPFKSHYRNIIDTLGLKVKSSEKHIPSEIMAYPLGNKIYSFLGGLYSTDGGYNKHNKSIDYSTTSKRLAYDLMFILSKFGIYASVFDNDVRGYNYKSYIVSIRGPKYLKKFEENILPFVFGYKHHEYKEICNSKSKQSFNYMLPDVVYNEIREVVAESELSYADIGNDKNYAVKKQSNAISDRLAEKCVNSIYLPITYSYLRKDFVPVRISGISYYGEEKVYDIEVEHNHNFIANGVVVHNCISKKTPEMPQMLEKIEKGFHNVTQTKYMLSDEQCDKILGPIMQCINDASRYAFSKCHSIAYSFLGYACGWLRHYYPLEYVATCLNVWKDKEDKTAEMMRYAGSHGIKIRPPKFRFSRADYFMDKETNSIYKGIRSVKYMNDEIAEQLYTLRDKEYDSFFDLLKDIKDKTSINSRQLNILIRLDFFSEFGNAKELGALVSWFDYFKQGEMKTIKKEKIHDDRLYKIIQMNSKETAKSFSIVNMDNILNSVESLTRGLGMADFTIREKMIDQMEYYGYIDISTGNMSMEERKKLIVMEIRASRTKKDNKIWAYFIKTQSVGSGKHGEFAILAKVFDKMELQQYDIIQAKKIHKKEYNGRVTWYLDEYSILSDI